MLDEHGVEFTYREYRKEPLSEDEIRAVLAKLNAAPADVLRKNDKAAKTLGVTGDEPAETLIALMADNPTLLQRPIGVRGSRAAVGRPPEALLALLDDA